MTHQLQGQILEKFLPERPYETTITIFVSEGLGQHDEWVRTCWKILPTTVPVHCKSPPDAMWTVHFISSSIPSFKARYKVHGFSSVFRVPFSESDFTARNSQTCTSFFRTILSDSLVSQYVLPMATCNYFLWCRLGIASLPSKMTWEQKMPTFCLKILFFEVKIQNRSNDES